MAGVLKINGTTFATEAIGAIQIENVTFDSIADNSISGDKIDGGTATPATLSGSILNATKMASSGTSIWKSNGTDPVLSENSGSVTFANAALENNTITMVANHTAVKSALNASGDAPIYACRAWCTLIGPNILTSHSTTGISAHGNISSVKELGTGRYEITMNQAMVDTDYCVLVTAKDNSLGQGNGTKSQVASTTHTNTTFTVEFWDWNGHSYEPPQVFVAIFR